MRMLPVLLVILALAIVALWRPEPAPSAPQTIVVRVLLPTERPASPTARSTRTPSPTRTPRPSPMPTATALPTPTPFCGGAWYQIDSAGAVWCQADTP